ncbi:MAG: lipid-A-disaccharide synthase, partial [Succinivibrionaceae bacterium]|nr:lipid-A-disaccharide synthase [Succinivibrionaceae bacterium]
MSITTTPHLYALIAGEPSGDLLGAGLMRAIAAHDPEASFIGIGGPRMIEAGLKSSFRMEELSVMGLVEVLSRLLPILRIRRRITRQLIAARPCAMVGIDLPDFNLAVERALKNEGIPTVHYVSPSVWAWREGRMNKIKDSCNEVLALLPFEKKYYDDAHMPCTYVGHTMANMIPLEVNQEQCRDRINLKDNAVEPPLGKVLGIMPGSRPGIIKAMLPIYAEAARLAKRAYPDLIFITAVPSHELAVLVKDVWLEMAPDLSLTVFVGQSQDVMGACDVVLLTSGTITLEAMLLKRPMVVAYRVNPLSAAIARRMLKVDMFSLPNLLAGRRIVPEQIQENCTPALLAEELSRLLGSDNLIVKKCFMDIHESMRTNSDELAAQAVLRQARSAMPLESPSGARQSRPD